MNHRDRYHRDEGKPLELPISKEKKLFRGVFLCDEFPLTSLNHCDTIEMC
jgi:hypothetical protein